MPQHNAHNCCLTASSNSAVCDLVVVSSAVHGCSVPSWLGWGGQLWHKVWRVWRGRKLWCIQQGGGQPMYPVFCDRSDSRLLLLLVSLVVAKPLLLTDVMSLVEEHGVASVLHMSQACTCTCLYATEFRFKLLLPLAATGACTTQGDNTACSKYEGMW